MPPRANDLLPRLQRSALHVVAPVQREVGRILHDLGDGWDSFGEFRPQPPMEIVATAAGLQISLEAPGLSAEDMTVSVEDDLLTVHGEATPVDEAANDPHVHGRPAFTRSVYLPRNIDPATIDAVMAHGVLKITAGCRPDAEVEIIPVRSA
jgi:HSP20 family molecular chaperone IbpA